jgi:hypothetical protein
MGAVSLTPLRQAARGLLCLLWLSLAAPALAASPPAEASANAKSAEEQFTLGNWEQALIHYRLAYEAVPNPDYLFNMAQCEYNLGQLKEALAHYQDFLGANDSRRRSDALEMARMRIKAINLRQSVFSIYSLPAGADVRIDGPKQVSGRAPSDFRVPSGKYTITISRPAYVSQTSEVDIGIAETKSLFFQLEPIPGRLEIRTRPAGATLYVRGNRARNPYLQEVLPGSYEIYAEASDYRPRRDVVSVRPGERLSLDFKLDYVQRSGRPELIGFWTAAGALAGTTLVLARLDTHELGQPNSAASGTLAAAGGLVGGAAGLLFATAYVPDYIRDNVALFRIGAMSIGAVEGASIGVAGFHKVTAGWAGGMLGLGVGAGAGIWLDHRAPNYGRVTVILSGAGMGALAGALMSNAVEPTNAPANYDANHQALWILGGLNAGLGMGLALAYLPDQRYYGPTWKHVALVDLAAAGGAFAGAVATTINKCLTHPNADQSCHFDSDRQTARFALAGGVLGLATGLFLTRNIDRESNAPSERRDLSLLPLPSALPVQGRAGVTVVPGLAAQGRF